MDRFQDQYRTPSNRWYGWDYGDNAAYYVTLCEKNRRNVFGNIVDNELQPSELGKVAGDCWQAIPEHFPFVELGMYVIMPNHIHGIIIIDKSLEKQSRVSYVETQNLASLRPGPYNEFGPQSRNLGSIIRGFKIGVTKYARQHNIPFTWQPRYHDHVIRDEEDFRRIQTYIYKNPINWRKDEYANLE